MQADVARGALGWKGFVEISGHQSGVCSLAVQGLASTSFLPGPNPATSPNTGERVSDSSRTAQLLGPFHR